MELKEKCSLSAWIRTRNKGSVADMNTIQSYWYVFTFLEEYYHHSNLDDLGGLLGDMLGDEALFGDWQDLTGRANLTETECLFFLTHFLRAQEAEFGIDLSSLINGLVNLEPNAYLREMWNRTPERVTDVFSRLKAHIGRDWKDLE